MSFYADKNQITQWNCVQQICTNKTFTVPCEKSNTVCYASSVIKDIVVYPALSKFEIER